MVEALSDLARVARGILVGCKRRQVERSFAPASRLVTVLADGELDQQVSAVEPVGCYERLIGVVFTAELFMRGREPAVQIGNQRGRSLGERGAMENLVEEGLEVGPA